MSVKWTEEQQKVISTRGKNVLVSAAAGSGKTAVLVQRILSLVMEEKVDIDTLLVVTFTRAAAAEMKERIRLALEAALSTHADDEHLQRQSTLVHHAQITTIHGFCSFVIRNYFQDIDLDPVYRVADEGEIMLMQKEVLAEVMEDAYAAAFTAAGGKPEEAGNGADAHTENDPGAEAFFSLVDGYTPGKSDEAIEDIVLKLYEYAQSYPFPDQWLSGCETAYAVDTIETLQGQAWFTQLFDEAKRLIAEGIKLAQVAIRICGENGGPYTYLPMLEADLDQLVDLVACADYAKLKDALSGIAFSPLSRKRDESIDGGKREQVKGMRADMKAAVANAAARCERSEEELLAELAACRVPVGVLAALVREFSDRFAKVKRRKNILDFSDLEHMALAVLVKDENGEPVRTAAAKELSDGYYEVMIDEYQDSNYIQEMLLQAVSKEADGICNRFMVGDVKQSIYGFRLARPELFLEKQHSYPMEKAASAFEPVGSREAASASEPVDSGEAASDPEPVDSSKTVSYSESVDAREVSPDQTSADAKKGAPSDHIRIDLHKNFRSRRNILDTANFIFRRIMCAGVGGIEYDDSEALYPGADYPEGSDPAFPVTEVLLIDKGTGTTDADQSAAGTVDTDRSTARMADADRSAVRMADMADADRSAARMTEAEAEAIAGRIRALVGKEQVWDKDAGTYRPVRYKDIVILLRSISSVGDVFLDVLKTAGIPAHTTSRTGYFSAIEVAVTLNYLRICDNLQQEIPLTSVLHSPIGNFSSAELAAIRSAMRGVPFYEACLQYAGLSEAYHGDSAGADRTRSQDANDQTSGHTPAEVDPAIRQKLRGFFATLLAIRGRIVDTPIHELIGQILDLTGYGDFARAMPAGQQRLANLDMLIEKAVEFEKTSYHGLFNFIRYIEQIRKYEVDYGEVNIFGEAADTVRIMTIHKSKGLEFPIVFVAGMGRAFNFMDTYGSIVLHSEYGIGLDITDKEKRTRQTTVYKQLIQDRLKSEMLAEELRVLYVALTRAKEKLILSGYTDVRHFVEKAAGIVYDENGRFGETKLLSARCYLDFVLPVLLTHRCFDPVLERFGANREGQDALLSDVSEITVQVLLPDDIDLFSDEETASAGITKEMLLDEADGLRAGSYDPETASLLSDRFAYRYPYADRFDLPVKLSVSELKRRGDGLTQEDEEQTYEPDIIPLIPQFAGGEGAQSGAARGTVYHTVFENLDYTALAAVGRISTANQEAKQTEAEKAEAKQTDTKQTGSGLAETAKTEAGQIKAELKRQIACMRTDGKLSEADEKSIRVSDFVHFLSSGIGARIEAAGARGALYREQPFVLQLSAKEIDERYPADEGILVQGIIDAFFEEEGGLVLVDYKTDRSHTKDGSDLADKYKGQLRYYRRALEQLRGESVKEIFIYSTHLGRAIPLDM